MCLSGPKECSGSQTDVEPRTHREEEREERGTITVDYRDNMYFGYGRASEI